jgi:hypothetical protein
MKLLIGKTGRVLKAVACRVNDREEMGRLCGPFELAIKAAVERAVQREARLLSPDRAGGGWMPGRAA